MWACRDCGAVVQPWRGVRPLGLRGMRRTREERLLELRQATSAMAAGLVIVLAPLVLGYFFITKPIAIGLGIDAVLLLGTAGLVLRGVGELRSSSRLKALGHFCGARAYLVTASTSLLSLIYFSRP